MLILLKNIRNRNANNPQNLKKCDKSEGSKNYKRMVTE